MAKREYLTAPQPTDKMPGGIPYILANEGAERFAFYGMSGILVVFMTKYLVGADGALSVMTDEKAKEWFHLFTAAVYFTPMLGALLADVFFGKYKTIVAFSLCYCVGLALLALYPTQQGLLAGLVLIALGSGVIKPCVSANVGDQFGQQNKHLLSKMYSWFYFSINVGACISMLACPWLLEKYGPGVGFGVPAALMIVATIVFVMGRAKYVHIPPTRTVSCRAVITALLVPAWVLYAQIHPASREAVNKALTEEVRGILDVLKILARLCILFVFVAMFFALYYQSQSAWVIQAEKMDLKWLGIAWLPAQVQFVNSFYILLMIPVFSYVIYPVFNKFYPMTPLRKIGLGMLVTAACFVVPAYVEIELNGGDVFKCSSRSPLTGLEPIRLIDGVTDDQGWSSGKQPTAQEPVELVLRLRERKAWPISDVTLDLSTTLSQAERAAADQDANSFEAGAYRPGSISIFAQDFSDELVPGLFTEAAEEDKAEFTAKQWAIKQGWKHLGDLAVGIDQLSAKLEFASIEATHVLVQIASNHGADRVKIAEIQVDTTEATPAESKPVVAKLWPNVAALGYRPSIGWQFFAYIILTAGEILASIAVLEFSYTQAPKKIKTLVMGLYLLSISLGNVFSAAVNYFIQNADGSTKLPGASYYWFFAIAMLVTFALYIPVAMFFPVKEYIQDEEG